MVCSPKSGQIDSRAWPSDVAVDSFLRLGTGITQGYLRYLLNLSKHMLPTKQMTWFLMLKGPKTPSGGSKIGHTFVQTWATCSPSTSSQAPGDQKVNPLLGTSGSSYIQAEFETVPEQFLDIQPRWIHVDSLVDSHHENLTAGAKTSNAHWSIHPLQDCHYWICRNIVRDKFHCELKSSYVFDEENKDIWIGGVSFMFYFRASQFQHSRSPKILHHSLILNTRFCGKGPL